ncbi:MAG: SUMF1/EgtB/PvdO family nonheme iron enzyme [Granulosicoccus sp.]
MRWLPCDKARALRGGSWINNDNNCRSSYRNNNHPDNRNNNIGFRVSCLSHIIGRIPLDQRANAGNSLRPRLQRRGTALQSLTQVFKHGSIMPVTRIAGG